MIPAFVFHKLSYAGLAFLLAFGGVVAPVPEEITLLTGGYLAAEGLMRPAVAIPLAIAAILFGDSVLFFLARSGAGYARRLRARAERLGIERPWLSSPRHPLRTVFILRFITGLRVLSPIYAGFHGVGWAGFLGTTLAALAILVPGLFTLGYFFHESFERLIVGFEAARHALFACVLLLVAAGMLAALYRFVRKEKSAEVAEGRLTPEEAAKHIDDPRW